MTVIDDYLKDIDPAQRKELEHIRTIVKRTVPDAEETIGYGMPVFKYKTKYLLGMCGFKNHMSIFPGAEPVETFKNQLKNYTTSKGTIQFTLDNPIPDSLLVDIIKDCLERIPKK